MSVEWIYSGGDASMVSSSSNKTLIVNVGCCTGFKSCELICSMAEDGEYKQRNPISGSEKLGNGREYSDLRYTMPFLRKVGNVVPPSLPFE